MTANHWTVIDKHHHADGGVTLTLRNSAGTLMTTNYPPGTVVQRLVPPEIQSVAMKCALCLEPCHMVNGVPVHDFTGSEKCTYRVHL